MLHKFLTSTATAFINTIAARMAHDWRRLSRNEWRHLQVHFSQYGEDLIARDLLAGVEGGCYVDVGAYDPVQFSNTLLLHRCGWHGVNIDLDEDKIARFKLERPTDISIAAAVGASARPAWVHEYQLSVLNRVTFDPEDRRAENGDLPTRTRSISLRPLDEILSAAGLATRIDYLNIDCEGLEMDVLRGLTFARWCPRLVSIEALEPDRYYQVRDFMAALGYDEVARTRITVFFSLPAATES